MFNGKKEKRLIKGLFSKFLRNDDIDKYLRNPEGLKINELSEKDVEFILIKIQQEDISKNSKVLPKTIEICRKYGSIDFFSNIIIVYLNIVPIFNNSNNSENIVDELTEFVGKNVSFLKGNEKCLYGNYGSNDRVHNGAIIPDIDKKIVKLFSMPMGSKEVL